MKLNDPEPKNPRAVRDALKAIQGKNADGLLVAEEVVAAAKESSSPLHKCFEWDDSTAGHQWRLMQARHLIRVQVVYADDAEEKAVPRFVSLISDRDRPKGGYRQTGDVMNSEQLRQDLEATAKRDIDGVCRRYEVLKDLCAKVREAAGISAATRKTQRARGTSRKAKAG